MKLPVILLFALASVGYTQVRNTLPEALKDVGLDQKLDAQVPLDLTFADESGNRRTLRELMHGRPAVLALVYYQCPMLCGMELNGLLRALKVTPLDAGKDFEILTISFDPREGPALAAAKKAEYVGRYKRPTANEGWHFLTGDEASISQLTKAVGFRYQFDKKSGQWAHASGIMTLTPEGRIARYQYGVEYSARDLKFSLIEASRGKIGSAVDQVLLFCFHYDPTTAKYSIMIMTILRGMGIATLFGLLAFWFVMYWQSRHKAMRERSFRHV